MGVSNKGKNILLEAHLFLPGGTALFLSWHSPHPQISINEERGMFAQVL